MAESHTGGARPSIHWLRYNERDHSPRAVAFVDTETAAVPGTEPEQNRLVLWAAERVVRSKQSDVIDWVTTAHGTTGDELADWVTESVIGVNTLWVYAHNLAYDLFTTRLLDRLHERGWRLSGAFSVSDHAPFFRMANGSKRLVITDSWSWLPDALESIGEAVRIVKPPLPPATDLDALLIRCQQDVVILRTAILQLLDWWDRNLLGNWSVTGAATGWNACRHMMSTPRILIDPDPAGRDHDYSAVYGGRRDAWRIGRMRTGPYVELDFRDSHPRLVATLPMPCKRGPERTIMAGPGFAWLTERRGWIAEAVVRTTQPRYPVRWAGGTWYPIGQFQTVLAAPELQMAADHGELVSVGSGRQHALGGALQPWGHWACDVAAGQHQGTSGVARIAVRAWGRTVIGKWAGRTSQVIAHRDALYGPYDVRTGWTAAHDRPLRMVSINGTEWTLAKDRWADNAYPAIWAWVESHLRVRLAAVIDALPAGCLITCHTDGVIVDANRMATELIRLGEVRTERDTPEHIVENWARRISKVTWPLTLRVKKVFSDLNVYGPAQMEVDNTRRWSGVRSDAEEVQPLVFKGRQWPKTVWQMQHYNGRGYLRPEVTLRPTGPFVHRWLTEDGQPAPIRMQWSPERGNVVLPFADSYHDHGRYPLSPHQHPTLVEVNR